MRGVSGIDARDPGEGTAVVDVSFARKVAEAGECNQTPLWIEGNEVRERSAEVVERTGTLIEQHRLRRHV